MGTKAYDRRFMVPPTDEDLRIAMEVHGVAGSDIEGALTDSVTGDRVVLVREAWSTRDHVVVKRGSVAARANRYVSIDFEVIPIAVVGSPDHVELVARYPDGSYDRAQGASVAAAFERIAVKLGDYFDGVDG